MEELVVTALVLAFSFGFSGSIAWTYPNWKGVVVGTLALWIFLFLGLVLLAGRYSEGGPGGLLVPFWFFSGWLFSGLFTLVIARIARAIRKSRTSAEGLASAQ